MNNNIDNTLRVHKIWYFGLGRLIFIPAEPNDKWYLLSGLNLTQHTLALASKHATECSMLVDHSLTASRDGVQILVKSNMLPF